MADQPLVERFNLRSRLRFNIESGQIWLDENRMLLLHAKAFGALRHELFESLDAQCVKGLLFRMGFVSGQHDADLARKLYGEGDNYDIFQIGLELHAFEGLVRTTISEADIDWEEGVFYGKVHCESSWEAESHLQLMGATDEPVCWSLAGYASGYVTRFFQRLVIFRETHCMCCGDAFCVFEGQSLEAWGDEPFLQHCLLPNDQGTSFEALQEELWQLRGSRNIQQPRGKLVGSSPAFSTAFNLLAKAANSPITVLLLGETGVGKEVFAQWLHENSDRAEKPFIAVNCAAIPNELIESELFGVEKGAYTGAQNSRPGKFERADGGTLFLDELGELSAAAQAKLLRVLQTGEVERLGDHKVRKVNVRLAAATNVNLQQAIADGRFRADLYYRLATYPLEIPPLRKRKSDIPVLAKVLAEKYAPLYHKSVPGISDMAMRKLTEYDWPGNVRELENLMERAVLLVPSGEQIGVEHLFPGTIQLAPAGAPVDREGQVGNADEAKVEQLYETLLDDGFDLRTHEARLLEIAVARAKGNLTHAARMLGLTRRQLAYRVKQAQQRQPG
ncbi:Fis family transcriptional regulator [Halopseudomonas bauzanensis]|nr:Fis family transcriptional regulator [Halopseudomonas bauzanensis]